MKRGAFYSATKLALHSSCLPSGLKEAFHFYHIAASSTHSFLEVIDERAIISIDVETSGKETSGKSTSNRDPEHFLIDFTLSSRHRFSCWLIGCQYTRQVSLLGS